MGVGDQLAHFPFSGGLAEDLEDRLVDPPRLLIAENVRWEDGASLEKRYGITAISGTTLASSNWSTNAKRLFSKEGRLFGLDVNGYSSKGIHLVAYSHSENTWSALSKANLTDVKVKDLIASEYDEFDHDSCVSVDYALRFVVWNRYNGSTNQIMLAVYDEVTGALVRKPTVVASGTDAQIPKVDVMNETTVVITYRNDNGAGDRLLGRTLVASTPNASLGVETELAAGIVCVNYDMECSPSANRLWVAMYTSGGGGLVYLNTYDASLALSTTVNFAAVSGPVAVTANGTTGFVAYLEAAGSDLALRVYGLSTLTAGPTVMLTLTAAVNIHTVGLHAESGTRCGLVAGIAETIGAVTYNQTFHGTVTNGAILSNSAYTYGIFPASKPYWSEGKCWFLYWNSGAGSEYAEAGSIGLATLIDDGSNYTGAIQAEPWGNIAPRRVPYDILAWGSYIFSYSFTGTGAVQMPRIERSHYNGRAKVTMTSYADITNPQRRSFADVDFCCSPSLSGIASPQHMSEVGEVAWLGDLALISGGNPHIFDGEKAYPCGFAWPPITYSGVTGPTYSGTGITGTYLYAFTWELTLANGDVMRSSPIMPSTAAVPANQTVTWLVPTMGLSPIDTGGAETLVVFRTVTTGSTYYRLSIGPAENVWRNVKNASYITVADADGDADIGVAGISVALADRAQIYSTGEPGQEVLDVAPPFFSCVTTFDSRWFGGHRNEIWFSKRYQKGLVPLFNESQRIIPSDASDIVVMREMDGKLVVFTTEEVFYISGTGPASNGQGYAYSDPALVVGAPGALTNRGAVVCPLGIVYMSRDRRIMLLGRDMSVVPIGAAVEDTTKANQHVHYAVWHVEADEVRFGLSTGGTTGLEVVLNIGNQQWTINKRTTGSGVSSGAIQACAYVAGNSEQTGTVYMSAGESFLYKEDPTSWLDGSTWITSTVETGWFKPAGVMGFARLKRVNVLTEQMTHHNLTATITRDYTDGTVAADVQSSAFAHNTVNSDVVGGVRQYDIHVAIQKGESWKVKLTDATPTSGTVGTGRGAKWNGITFTFQTKSSAQQKQPSTLKG